MQKNNSIHQQAVTAAIRKDEMNKGRALDLRISARNAAEEIFQCGDLDGFLELVSRLHYYDVYNLLLIHQQFPKATCLAGYNFWKTLYDGPDNKLIKPEWKGKGIDLIVPLVDQEHSSFTWSAVKQYDISQTNVSINPLAPSVYIQDAGHLRILLESIVNVIATEYHRSVIRVASSSALSKAGLPGQMNDVTIMLRDDVRPTLQIHFLCECLCQLAADPISGISDIQMELCRQYMVHCLFRSFSLSPVRVLQKSSVLLDGIRTEEQIEFLHQIQKVVRRLDSSISAAYRFIREEEEDSISLS